MSRRGNAQTVATLPGILSTCIAAGRVPAFIVAFEQAVKRRQDAPSCDATESERALWLKAVLILEACTKGVKPFVAKVMQRLHSRVVENVKQDVARDVGACDDEDWNCSTCGDADDVKFTENGPVALDICTMDSNGVADCQTAHYLKPYTLKPCRLRNIPSD